MKRKIVLMLSACIGIANLSAENSTYTRSLETLDRGLVVLPAQEKGQFLSWRIFNNDNNDLKFKVLRNGEEIVSGLNVSNYVDTEGKQTDSYQIVCGHDTTNAVKPWSDLFARIPLNRPQGGELDGRKYVYTPNDCSVGDVDGDGRYEIILKWDPSNAHDNAHDGYTGNVILDCYTLEGKQLWRIDLGRNIRAGAHYTQFLVYDFDGDGKAEMICKTAPGSIDGTQHFVSEAATDDEIKKVDNSAVYVNKRGRILTGEEFLTVFDGLTGKSIHTIWYNPNRALSVGGNTDYSPEWGDENGNRGERFLACAAFLDGLNKRPSAVMCRGYYTQSNLWAVDFDGKQLKTKWLHCSPSPSEWYVKDGEGNIIKQDTGLKHSAFGQGTHSVAVGDVDGDGADEIIYGSCAIDNDGSLLHSTGLGHGDALHLGDLDPDRPGLEVFMPHEAYPYGASLRDAKTGEILWRCYDKEDTGRGLTADIDSTHRGSEIWSFAERAFYSIKGEKIADIAPPANFRIYWDGDLQDELLANTRIDWRKRGRDGSPAVTKSSIQKWDGEKMVTIPFSNGKTMYEMGNSVACNGSKATPCLQADILGDWREELIEYDSENGSYLNIFTTNIPTVHRIPTLMHDHIYRMGIVWQNVTYNQPPHVGYYMGDK